MDQTNVNGNLTNVIDEVLAPREDAHLTLPEPLASAADMTAAAGETLAVFDTMAEPNLSDAQKGSFRAQYRPSQGGVTGLAARMLGHSPLLAQHAKLPAGAVDNLLSFETGVGAVRQAAWPLSLYGRLRFRRAGTDLGQAVQQVDTQAQIVQTGADVLLGKAEGEAVKQAQSDTNKKERLSQRAKKGEATVTTQTTGVMKKRAAETLLGDINAGKARTRLPAREVPATPSGPKTGSKTTGKTKTKATGMTKGKAAKTKTKAKAPGTPRSKTTGTAKSKTTHKTKGPGKPTKKSTGTGGKGR